MCEDKGFKVQLGKTKTFSGTEPEIFDMLVSRYFLQKGEVVKHIINRPIAA